MRDPIRISRILLKLQRAWKDAPDLRLGQLVHNVVSLGDTHEAELTFNLEDDRFEKALDKWLAEPPRYIHPKT